MRKMVDCLAAPTTDPSRWRSLERCPSAAATLFFFCIWQIWSMDQPEPVATLRGGSPIFCLDWHRRVEAGTTRWFIVGFVLFTFFWFVRQFIPISVQRMSEWRSVCLGHASGRSSDESPQTFWTFRWGLVSGFFTGRPFPFFCRWKWESAGVVHQGESLLQYLNNSSVNFKLNLQKWQPIFKLETKREIPWKGLRWNSAGTKLAIPNYSPEVNDDQCNRISFIQFHFLLFRSTSSKWTTNSHPSPHRTTKCIEFHFTNQNAKHWMIQLKFEVIKQKSQ